MSEQLRLEQNQQRQAHWKRWGPYLPDRQWSTVREDYSPEGQAWQDFDHEMARSRTYRWGEDGLLGWCDRQCRLCFSLALWNGRDPFLKERLFGLTGPEGNHGEDVKEVYYFLDSTPTHSYCKGLYRYPQGAFPYEKLRQVNAARSRQEDEYELVDTGALDETFDCFVEYAKESPNDTLIRITVVNRGTQTARLTMLPTLWFRNTWSWGRQGEGYTQRPEIRQAGRGLESEHETLGPMHFWVDGAERWLFTENETNRERLYGQPNGQPYVKDAFHRCVVEGREDAVNPQQVGTKAAAWLVFDIEPGDEVVVRCRLRPEPLEKPFGKEFDLLFARRVGEAEAFYRPHAPKQGVDLWRQALAGLFWSKKFYYYDVAAWLEGDPVAPPPSPKRKLGRNHRWAFNLYNRDVLLLPDSWEYPWYAAWDTAFHVVPLASIDADLAKEQLILLVREWYQHPNGQIPAY